nr:MAG TPA: hypothetical protein [Caudoviricetes sp.]
MKAYKGFNKNLQCRGYRYEIGKTFEEDDASLCSKGFHACEYPLDCFNYYAPADSRYCEVEIEDNGERNSEDTKVCGKKIRIGAEVGIKELIRAASAYVKAHCTNTKQGQDRCCLTGGDKSALTGGYGSALTGGDWSALTGGNWSALTGGYGSALTGGNWSVVYGGENAKVRAGIGYVLALQYWADYKFIGVKCKAVDGKKIKANTWYRLDKAGRFIEARE